MKNTTVVIKYGGHAMENEALGTAFGDDLAQLLQRHGNFVLVHGGGPQISSLLKRLDIKSHFVNGLRVTDAAVMSAVEMVLCGQVNKAVVTALSQRGVPAAGISGRDGNLLQAEIRDERLGLVGEVKKVDPSLLSCLLAGGFVPVVAPVASSPSGQALNINADTAAGMLAGALRADYFILVSDVPGVLDANGSLLPGLNSQECKELQRSGVISGGMIPKVEACLNALAHGCRQTLILDGRAPSSLRRYLLGGEPLGTVITKA